MVINSRATHKDKSISSVAGPLISIVVHKKSQEPKDLRRKWLCCLNKKCVNKALANQNGCSDAQVLVTTGIVPIHCVLSTKQHFRLFKTVLRNFLLRQHIHFLRMVSDLLSVFLSVTIDLIPVPWISTLPQEVPHKVYPWMPYSWSPQKSLPLPWQDQN